MEPLYLSRLQLAMRNRFVRRDLSDCYAMHRRLLSVFPHLDDLQSAREYFGLLYRLEPGDEGATLLVQSQYAPDWLRLPNGYLGVHSASTKRIDDVYASLTEGQYLRFRLRANPTRRISARNATQEERWRGKRVELRSEDVQLSWLTRKAEQCGFRLIALHTSTSTSTTPTGVDVRASGVNEYSRGTRDGRRLTFAAVTFEGHLQVIESLVFQQTLRDGIGSGKAFGFGLLSIAPASL